LTYKKAMLPFLVLKEGLRKMRTYTQVVRVSGKFLTQAMDFHFTDQVEAKNFFGGAFKLGLKVDNFPLLNYDAESALKTVVDIIANQKRRITNAMK
jgi:hypothetical protein